MRESFPQKALRELKKMLEDAPFPDEGSKKDSSDVLTVMAWRLNLDNEEDSEDEWSFKNIRTKSKFTSKANFNTQMER